MAQNKFEQYIKKQLNRFYGKYIGQDQRPTYHDIETTYPSLHRITAAFAHIQKEFQNVLTHNDNLPRYHDLDPNQAEISDANTKKWNVFMLSSFGDQLDNALKLCPQTCQVLKTIPNVMQAFFSILEPGKSIPLHSGPYMGYLRYHLGIQVPKHNPPHIIINQQPHTWREGEAVFFDDSWPHEVVNHSDECRAVLIVDVLRPMPFLPNLINTLLINCFVKYTYGKQLKKLAQAFNPTVKPLFQ